MGLVNSPDSGNESIGTKSYHLVPSSQSRNVSQKTDNNFSETQKISKGNAKMAKKNIVINTPAEFGSVFRQTFNGAKNRLVSDLHKMGAFLRVNLDNFRTDKASMAMIRADIAHYVPSFNKDKQIQWENISEIWTVSELQGATKSENPLDKVPTLGLFEMLATLKWLSRTTKREFANMLITDKFTAFNEVRAFCSEWRAYVKENADLKGIEVLEEPILTATYKAVKDNAVKAILEADNSDNSETQKKSPKKKVDPEKLIEAHRGEIAQKNKEIQALKDELAQAKKTIANLHQSNIELDKTITAQEKTIANKDAELEKVKKAVNTESNVAQILARQAQNGAVAVH